MSKKVRGMEVSGTEPLGGETLKCSRVLTEWSDGGVGDEVVSIDEGKEALRVLCLFLWRRRGLG